MWSFLMSPRRPRSGHQLEFQSPACVFFSLIKTQLPQILEFPLVCRRGIQFERPNEQKKYENTTLHLSLGPAISHVRRRNSKLWNDNLSAYSSWTARDEQNQIQSNNYWAVIRKMAPTAPFTPLLAMKRSCGEIISEIHGGCLYRMGL